MDGLLIPCVFDSLRKSSKIFEILCLCQRRARLPYRVIYVVGLKCDIAPGSVPALLWSPAQLDCPKRQHVQYSRPTWCTGSTAQSTPCAWAIAPGVAPWVVPWIVPALWLRNTNRICSPFSCTRSFRPIWVPGGLANNSGCYFCARYESALVCDPISGLFYECYCLQQYRLSDSTFFCTWHTRSQ